VHALKIFSFPATPGFSTARSGYLGVDVDHLRRLVLGSYRTVVAAQTNMHMGFMALGQLHVACQY
jgi:hypothetical protein